MKNFPYLLFKTFIFTLLFLLFFFVLMATLFHTQMGQEYFLSYLHKWGQKNQINVSSTRAEILSPFSFKLYDVNIQIAKSEKVIIDQVTTTLSPLPLFAKRLVISNLSAHNVVFLTQPTAEQPEPLFQIHLKNHWIDLPFSLEISSFQIASFQLQKNWKVSGKGKVRKEGREILFALMATPLNDKSSSLQLVGSISKTTRSFRSRLIIDTPSLSSLFPVANDASLFLQIDGNGSVDNFYRLIAAENQDPNKIALSGKIKGKVRGLPFFEKPPFKNLKIDKGQVASNYQIRENGQTELLDLFYINEKTALKGYCLFSLGKAFSSTTSELLSKCDFSLKTKNLSIQQKRLPSLVMEKASGNLHFDATISPLFDLTFFSPQIQIGDQTIEELSLSSQLKFKEKGSGSATFIFKKELAKASATFQWEGEKLFSLTSSSLFLPTAHASAILSRTEEGLLTGRIEIHLNKMNLIYALFPAIPFLAESGDLVLHLYSSEQAKQEAQVQADLANFHYKNLFGQKAYLSIDTAEPFSDLKGTLKFLLQDARWHDLVIKGLFLETSNFQENWPYECFLTGTWREPLQIRSSGFWKLSSNDLLVTIETLSGQLLAQPLLAPEPVQWEWSPDHFSMKNFRFQLASSSLEGSILLSEKEAEIHLHSKDFPIDFLSFNPLNLRVRGSASMDADLVHKDQRLNGKIALSLEKLFVYSLSEKNPLKAMGSFEGSVVDNHFNVKNHLALNQTEIMDFSAIGEIHFSPFPFHLAIDQKSPIYSRLVYNGGIEEFLDFFDLGTHRLKGHLHSQLELSQTLEQPQLNGFCHLKQGTYENYYTGSYVKNMQAELVAQKDLVRIKSLTASDTKSGSLEAQGLLLLDPKRHFPFLILAYLDKLSSIQTDLIEATTSGKLEIKGTSLFAKATGSIEVNKASLSVPDRIPPFIPSFPITYRNHPFSQKEEEKTPTYTPYPLYLHLDLFAKDHIKISGKGLNAECNGSLKIEGSYADLIAKGQLNLLHGDYSFSGRVFTLTQGSLTFPGAIRALPVLSLAGQVEQKGVIITAYLKGPLNAPTITFESLPPLPLSSIMSLLIFGQDISEISGIQAIQLATSIASLSNGSNLLEAARKNLGIDRFTIISTPAASPDESEKIAVQVGKYITKDVLVSLTQGTQEDSSNISVEVDLKHGFIFQAETMQQEEQSKFTLKWNINY